MTNSTYVGQTCPFCRTPIQPGAAAVICSACGVPHHQACWLHQGRCTTLGCQGTAYSPDGQVMPPAPAAPPQPVAAAPTQPPPMQAPPEPPAYPQQQPMPGAYPPPPPTPYGQTPMAPQMLPYAMMPDLYLESDNTLVVRNGAVLPPICIATGATHNLVRRRRTENWSPPWVAILILVGLLVYAIVAAIMNKSGTYEFFIDQETDTKRRWMVGIDWIIFAVLFAGAFPFFGHEDTIVVGVIMMIVSIFLPIILYYAVQRLYTVKKIENNYIWLRFRKPDMAAAIFAMYASYLQPR